MRWGHFTDFYPIDCDFSIDDDGDGTFNWFDSEWLDPNSPILTTPSERVVCPASLDVCIDWSDCGTDFDNDGVVNCNDYSVSDPAILDACQFDDSCGRNDGGDNSTDLELEPDEPVDAANECAVDSCPEIDNDPPDGVEEKPLFKPGPI